MSKISLTTYIKKIEASYIIAREKYETITAKISAENERYNSIDRNMYNMQGLTQIDELHKEEIKKLEKQIATINDDFETKVSNIKEESDKIFDSKYCYTPKDIDAKGMAILEYGGLTTKEIRKLANDYKKQGNNTMYFMCAECLKDSELPEDRALYGNALSLRKERPDHNLLDGFVEMCKSGIRTRTTFSNKLENGISASDRIHAEHENILRSVLSNADSITIDIDNPFE